MCYAKTCFPSLFPAIENRANTSSSNSFQDHHLNIDGKMPQRKQWSKSECFQDQSSDSFETMAQNAQSENSFKTPHESTGKSLLSRTIPQKWHKWTKIGFFQDHRLTKWENGRFFQNHGGWIPKVDFFQDPCKSRVKNSTPDIWSLLMRWVKSFQILRQQKMAQPVKDQPLNGPPPKGSRFNPHLHGVRIYIHWQYQGSSSIVPHQFWLDQRHVRRIWHQDRSNSPSSATQKTEGSHQVQGGDRKRAGRDGASRNHHQTDRAHTMG